MSADYCERTLSAQDILNLKIFPDSRSDEIYTYIAKQIEIGKIKKFEYGGSYEEMSDYPRNGESPTYDSYIEDSNVMDVETRVCDNFVLEYHIKIHF